MTKHSLASELLSPAHTQENERGDSLLYLIRAIREHNKFEFIMHVQQVMKMSDVEFSALYYLVRKWCAENAMSKVFEINKWYNPFQNGNTRIKRHLLRHESLGNIRIVYREGNRYFRPTGLLIDKFAEAFKNVSNNIVAESGRKKKVRVVHDKKKDSKSIAN